VAFCRWPFDWWTFVRAAFCLRDLYSGVGIFSGLLLGGPTLFRGLSCVRQGPSEEKPFTNFGDNGPWASRVRPFFVPPFMPGTGKDTNFNFCMQVVENFGKGSLSNGRLVSDSRKFSRHPYIGRIALVFALRGLSCLLTHECSI